MNAYNFKAIMFDIDACLIDSAPNLILTLDRAVADTGGGHHPPEYLRKMLGLPGYALDATGTLLLAAVVAWQGFKAKRAGLPARTAAGAHGGNEHG